MPFVVFLFTQKLQFFLWPDDVSGGNRRRRRQELLSAKYFRSSRSIKTCFNCNLLLFSAQTQQRSSCIVVRLSFKVASQKNKNKKQTFLNGMEIYLDERCAQALRESERDKNKRTSSSSMSELNDFDK